MTRSGLVTFTLVLRPRTGGGGRPRRALTRDGLAGLVGADTLEDRVPDVAVRRPLAEGDLDDHLGLDPVLGTGGALRPTAWRRPSWGRRRGLSTPSFERAAYSSCPVLEFQPVPTEPAERRVPSRRDSPSSRPPTSPLAPRAVGVADDDELLSLPALELQPSLRAGTTRRARQPA